VIEQLVKDHRLAKKRACQIVKLSRAAYYRGPSSHRATADAEVIKALNQIVGHPRYRDEDIRCIDTVRAARAAR
jgi:hypothetical protein